MTKLPLAEYDWLITTHGNVLHHATFTPEQDVECEEWGGLYDVPITLDCGRAVTTVLIPGILSRMGAPRCIRCCKATGLPVGKGSPKNDEECRRILGMGGT